MKFKYQHLDNWSDLTKQDLSCLLRIETVYVPSPPSLGEEERSRLLFIPRGWKTIADSWRLHKVEKSSRGQPLHAKDRSWPPQWVGISRGWFSPLQPRTVRPFARSACAGLLGCCWELMSVGHVRAKPGHPRSHGQPGGGTVKPRSLATSLFPPPVIFFPALRMAIHHCKSLALKKKKKGSLSRRWLYDGTSVSLSHQVFKGLEMFSRQKVMLYSFLPRVTARTVLVLTLWHLDPAHSKSPPLFFF